MRPAGRDSPGVYVDLAELVKLEPKARGFSFLPRQPVHSLLTGKHASRLRGRGLDFEEIRRYLPGDDIRTIDWRVTARTRKPHVRVYTEERERPVLLVVDQRLSMFFGSRRAMKSVVAAEIAALGAWRVLSQGDRVGALVFDDLNIVEIRPHRSRARVMQVLGAVAKKNQALSIDAGLRSRPEMLNRVLERTVRLATHDFLVCIVSDFDGMDPSTRRLASLLSVHNDVIVVFVHDPLEAQLPDAGRVVMAAGELQLEVNTTASGLRRRYAEDFDQRLEKIREISRQRAIGVLPIATGEDVAEQVRRRLGYFPPAGMGERR